MSDPFRTAYVAFALVVAAQPALGAEKPFLNFREQSLGYFGPSVLNSIASEIKIAWFGPGEQDPHDPDIAMWRAAILAVDEANAVGGSGGVPFRLVSCWNADPWKSGASLLAKLVYQEHPLLIVGSVDSATTHLAEQIVAKANLPLVSPVATDPSVTLAGVSWAMSCAPSDSAIAEAIVSSTRNPVRRTAIVAGTDHQSRACAREVQRRLSDQGQLPAFRFDITPGLDCSVALEALVESKPEVVLLLSGPADAERVLRVVRARLPASRVVGGPHLASNRFLALAGDLTEGVRVPLLYRPDTDPVFARKFEQAYGTIPDYRAAFAYDALTMITQVLRDCPVPGDVLRAKLMQNQFRGVTGNIQFGGTGQNSRTNIEMGIVSGGRFVGCSGQFADSAK